MMDSFSSKKALVSLKEIMYYENESGIIEI
jgi:hypothetical protein